MAALFTVVPAATAASTALSASASAPFVCYS